MASPLDGRQEGAADAERSWLWRVRFFLLRWFLPLGFAVAVLLGLSWPEPGKTVSSWQVGSYRLAQTLNVMTVFVVSGLCLRTADVKSALGREGAPGLAFGLLMILGVTPLAGFAAVRLPFSVTDFKYGLALFCAVPTTIASGTAIVAEARGNTALALLLTVSSNLLGVVVTPLWLHAYFSGEEVSIDVVELLINLLITVLAPLLVGQAVRFLVPPVRAWVAEHGTLLKLLSNTSLVLIVWQTVSSSADEILAVPDGSLAAITATGAALHVFFLVLTYLPARYLLPLELPELKATVIMGSEKTLPVSVAIIPFLTALGSEGLLSIPPIVSQQAQLFIDAFIAWRWSDTTSAHKDSSARAVAVSACSPQGDIAADVRRDLRAPLAGHSPAAGGGPPSPPARQERV